MSRFWRSGWTRTLVLVAIAGPVAAAAAAAGASRIGLATPLVTASALAAGVGVALVLVALAARRTSHVLDALEDGVRGLRSADYSLRLAVERGDELGALVDVYNELADALRADRRDIYQRELLLDSLLQGVPVATFLAGPTGRVVFSNRAARQLLGGGRRLEGHKLAEVLVAGPPELREALAADGDSIFTVRLDGAEETFKAARRTFELNGQDHVLHLVERLTPELRRREVEAWKNAVRIVNHELNNSLAPIRSLVHSARVVLEKPEHAHRLQEIFAAVEERVTHLAAFLTGYSAFARLPAPVKKPVAWRDLLDRVRQFQPFTVDGALPDAPAQLDASLMEQALMNLVKNAHESGGPADEVRVSVTPSADGGAVLRVLDRGRGMDDEALRRALVPFYTSKPQGTGLGLPLSSEIVEAHGGRLQLSNREGGGLEVTCRLPGV